MKKLDGQNIVELRTINSMYANNCILAIDNRNIVYRLPCSTIIQMINSYEFEVNKKKVHSYLINANSIYSE